MAMDIKKAIEAGDKVGVFGHTGPSLRGTLRTIITDASAKNKTVNLDDAMAGLKSAGIEMEMTDKKGNKVSIEGKVKTALEDLKYTGKFSRAVTDDDTREYYVTPASAEDPEDNDTEEDVE